MTTGAGWQLPHPFGRGLSPGAPNPVSSLSGCLISRLLLELILSLGNFLSKLEVDFRLAILSITRAAKSFLCTPVFWLHLIALTVDFRWDGIFRRDRGFDAGVQWSCNILKTMELVSGIEPPYGLRITNGNKENDGFD